MRASSRRTIRIAVLLLACTATRAASPLDAIVRADVEPLDLGEGLAPHRVLELDFGHDHLVVMARADDPDATRFIGVNGTLLVYDAEARAEYERLLAELRLLSPDEVDRRAIAPKLTLLDEQLHGSLNAPEQTLERLRALSLALWAGLLDNPSNGCWQEGLVVFGSGVMTVGTCAAAESGVGLGFCTGSIGMFAVSIHDWVACMAPENPPGTEPREPGEDCEQGSSPCLDGCCPDMPGVPY